MCSGFLGQRVGQQLTLPGAIGLSVGIPEILRRIRCSQGQTKVYALPILNG